MTVSSARTGMVQVLNVVGRLRPGTTRDAARAEIEVIRSRSAAAHPAPFDDQRTLRIVPLHDELVGGAGRALPVLLGAVAFVLLIACANAANLLLARASARQREIAVRMAVGAARGRLLRQLLVESVVLAGIGGAAGLLLANAAVAGLLRVARRPFRDLPKPPSTGGCWLPRSAYPPAQRSCPGSLRRSRCGRRIHTTRCKTA